MTTTEPEPVDRPTQQAPAVAASSQREDTRTKVLAAARASLLANGYAALSTRGIAEAAGVPLSQIHYHFGSKKALVLALLEVDNTRLLERQASMYRTDLALSKRWDLACDFFDEDLSSGYVRVLQEMIAAGWADEEVATAVRVDLLGWYRLLHDLAHEIEERIGGLGPFSAEDIASLISMAFIGSEAMVLLGFETDETPVRRSLRRVGSLLESLESEPTNRSRS